MVSGLFKMIDEENKNVIMFRIWWWVVQSDVRNDYLERIMMDEIMNTGFVTSRHMISSCIIITSFGIESFNSMWRFCSHRISSKWKSCLIIHNLILFYESLSMIVNQILCVLKFLPIVFGFFSLLKGYRWKCSHVIYCCISLNINTSKYKYKYFKIKIFKRKSWNVTIIE